MRHTTLSSFTARGAVRALIFALYGGIGIVSAQLPLAGDGVGTPTLAPLLQNVTPAVVNISVVSTSVVARNPLLDDPFYRRFFQFPEQRQPLPRQAAGSGVIIDASKGHVLTNYHVIENADEITVTLTDGRHFSAELIGSDSGTDIALLRIDAEGLTEIPLGDSDRLRVGDFVVAIGNPFGLGQTVTSGIVSALGRSGLNIEGYEDFIQTDAPINPGNSGGGLVSLDGTLVGINTAIIAPGGGNVGIGFAVPSKMAQSVIEQLLEYGEVRRGRLGVTVQDLTPDLASALGLEVARGAVVTKVDSSSSAERAGIQPGDVIVAVNSRPVSRAADLKNRIGLMPVGETAIVTVLRDGKREQFEARVADMTSVADGGKTIEQLDGGELTNLDSGDSRYRPAQGVLVLRVQEGSSAWGNGLRSNDIILRVKRTPIGSVQELARALQQSGSAIALSILRDEMRLFLVIQ